MKLEIKGYKNIEELNYEIIDRKVNFIFGISGSGKSSISNALIDTNRENNKKFGFTSEQIIKINNLDPDNFVVDIFDSFTSELYFGNNVDENVQNILIDDNNEYKNALAKMNSLLQNIVNVRDSLKDKYKTITEIVKKLGAAKLNKGNKLSSKSVLIQTITTIENAKTNKIFKDIEELGDDKFEWLLTGYDKFQVDDNCPYCGKKLSQLKLNKLLKFKEYNSKNMSTIHTQSENYKLISGNIIGNTLSSLKHFEKQLIKMSIACTEYEKLNLDIDKCYQSSSNENMIQKFNYSNEFYEIFPELKKPINKLNSQINSLRSAFRKAKDKTSNILKRKTQMINRILANFSIPYEVNAKYYKDKITDYRLIHKKDLGKNDDKEKLSSGEKFIVSLILFILKVQKDSPNLIIFDDPVSSYDEYRRKQVLDLIMEKLKDETILILSHDQVFAKYAVLNKSKSLIGKVDYLENFSDIVRFTEINSSDFEVFRDSVLNRISELNANSYYMKIVNLRTLCEGNNDIIYSYLSAILHTKPVSEIHNLIIEKNTTEVEILRKIREKFNIILPPVYNDYYANIDTRDLTIFEKGLLLREYLKNHSNVDKKIKKELDSYIHLNSRLHLCLNPYSFPFCSQKVYDSINLYINGIINIRD